MQFEINPIDEGTALVLREKATTTVVADEYPGFPCRLCLRDARVGEKLVLVSHDPFHSDSPYRSASPIYLHQTPCTRWQGTQVPDQQRRRTLSMRAFDHDEIMVRSEVINGEEFETAVANLFKNASVVFLHVHNASPGCWALRVDRAER